MLSSYLKISNTADGLTASPKISHDLLATLGVKPGSLNFQQLMNSRLGALNSHKNGAASLSFLSSMTKQFADFSPRGLGDSELLSIKQIVQSFKTQAGKSQKPLAFQFNSKSLGKISFEIEPAKNQLKVGLDEEHLDVSELFIAELAPLFDQIEFGPVFSFQQSVFSNQLSTHSFQSSALGSQLSVTQFFGVIKELIEGSGKLPVKANNLGQKIELNVESIGKIAVDLKTVNGKLLVQLTVDSNAAKNLLSERLGREIQNLDIRVKEVGTSKRGKGFDGQFKLNSKLITSKAIQSIRDVLLGSATPVKSQTAKVSNRRPKASSKLSKNKVSARGKNFQQDSRALALPEDKLKLKNDVSSRREFLGEILENIEGDSGELFESILNESERPTQPVLTGNNVNFDFLGGKLVGSGTVERSHLPQMLQRILEFANSQSNTAGQKLEIQLDVEKLGSLLVNAVKQKDKINLHINVDNSEARRILETQLRPLLDQMIKEGIEVGKLEVSVKNENADHRNEWQTTQNDREFRKQHSNLEHPNSSYAKKAIPVSRQRDFGYNSIEVLA